MIGSLKGVELLLYILVHLQQPGRYLILFINPCWNNLDCLRGWHIARGSLHCLWYMDTLFTTKSELLYTIVIFMAALFVRYHLKNIPIL
jgi:hypothetical protein